MAKQQTEFSDLRFGAVFVFNNFIYRKVGDDRAVVWKRPAEDDTPEGEFHFFYPETIVAVMVEAD